MKVKSESEVAQSCPTPATPWIAAYQAPPSMGFSRQKYWSMVKKKIVYVKTSYKSETTVLKVVSKCPGQIGSLLSKMLLPHLTLRLKIVMISSQVNLM